MGTIGDGGCRSCLVYYYGTFIINILGIIIVFAVIFVHWDDLKALFQGRFKQVEYNLSISSPRPNQPSIQPLAVSPPPSLPSPPQPQLIVPLPPVINQSLDRHVLHSSGRYKSYGMLNEQINTLIDNNATTKHPFVGHLQPVIIQSALPGFLQLQHMHKTNMQPKPRTKYEPKTKNELKTKNEPKTVLAQGKTVVATNKTQDDPFRLPKPDIPLDEHESTGSVYYKQMVKGKKPVASISQYMNIKPPETKDIKKLKKAKKIKHNHKDKPKLRFT